MVATVVFRLAVTHSLSRAAFGSERGIDAGNERVATRFNQGDTQLLITVSSDDGIQSGAASGSAPTSRASSATRRMWRA